MFPYRLYLVLSGADCAGRELTAVAAAAIRGGVDLVQLREKTAGTAEFLEKALRLQEVLDQFRVPLIINDNLEVAMKAKAFGIHVGNNDLSPVAIRAAWKDCRSLGYSIEYAAQLDTEETRAADCLGISPVFRTATKSDTVTEWGLEGVAQLRRLTDKPLVAIGNMHAGNVSEVIKAGADCIAVVSAICQAADPERAAAQIRDQIEQAL